MTIQENISLRSYNTFGVAVNAKYFTEVTTIEELLLALDYASKNTLATLFLGGGSNILFTKDFEGLVIRLNFKGISSERINNDEVLVTAQAGENWHQFILFCLENNFGGLENLSLIPGNVGTSPMQNIGAYGVEIKDVFHQCKVLNLETLSVETFDTERCAFGYRESYFKRDGKGKYIILEVTFRLTTRNHMIKTEYGAIKDELNNMGVTYPTIQQVSQAVINIRQSKLPDPKITGNAGSFFKNPSVSREQFERLKVKFEGVPGYPNDDLVKVPAGWLIEKAGWKGNQIGNVACHRQQALVIINATGDATGDEIYKFSDKIITSVKDQFNIELEREVNIV